MRLRPSLAPGKLQHEPAACSGVARKSTIHVAGHCRQGRNSFSVLGSAAGAGSGEASQGIKNTTRCNLMQVQLFLSVVSFFFSSSVLRWILESLHDPKYMLRGELWYYRKVGSCGIFSMNGILEGILHCHYFLHLLLLPITTTSSPFPVYPLFDSQLF